MGRQRAVPTKRPVIDDSNSDDDFEPGKQSATPFSPGSNRKKAPSRKVLQNLEENLQKGKKKATKKTSKKEKTEEVFWDGNNPDILKSKSISYASRHIVHGLQNLIHGTQPTFWQQQAFNTPVMERNKKLRVHKTYLSFDRRVTSMAWHPTNPNLVAVGSKGGDIALWNYVTDGHKPRTFITGHGPGGSIQRLQFDERNGGSKIYTVSIDGTFSHYDLMTEERSRFLDTGDINHWFTALDVFMPGKVISVGDNKGNVNLLSQDGEKIWEHRLHPQKVTHIEFCPRMPWCFVTASVDRSLKVWDIRNIKSRSSCLHQIMHDKPINSAYFSRTDGGRLLTTDQHSEMRVYSCPSFTLSKVIPHPHRQFQHLTPIKASWHPLRDIIVVGRYPDPHFPGSTENEPRTVDFFDGVTGELLHQHMDKDCANKIISLNLFNHSGEALLSGGASHVWVWTPQFCTTCKRKNGKDSNDSDGDSDDNNNDKYKKPRTKTNRKKTKSENGDQFKVVRGLMVVDRRW